MPKSLLLICPTFNEAKNIHRLIESLQNQSFSDWKLLVVDNGSKDQTVQKVLDHSRQDSRILLHRFYASVNVWQSLIQSFSVAVTYPKFDFYMYVGADDHIVGVDFLERVIAEFRWWVRVVIPRIKNPLVKETTLNLFNQNLLKPISVQRVLTDPRSSHLCFSIFRGAYFRKWAADLAYLGSAEISERLIPFLALSTLFKESQASSYYLKYAKNPEKVEYYPEITAQLESDKWRNDYSEIIKRFKEIEQSIVFRRKLFYLSKKASLLFALICTYAIFEIKKFKKRIRLN